MTVTFKEFQPRYALRIIYISAFFTLFANVQVWAEEDVKEEINAGDQILHHVLDDHIWHFFDGHYGTLYLPVIVYSQERGLDVFSSSRFYDEHHNVVPYNGYLLEHGHVVLEGDTGFVLDLSITKNVFSLFILAVLLILIFRAVAKGYEKNEGRAPSGIQSFLEPVILYIRDEVVKPNIAHNHEKYLPFLLTLFFFIFIGNLIGLTPGAANLTGNIAVTMVLAIFTFIITNVNGTRKYWGHIFNPPGIPLPIKPLLVLVEFIGLFTKPISLMVRLFVAITAGHIVMLSLITLIFIFQSYYVGIGSTLIVLFINTIELLVAGIQAYVFTMFSALYIGLSTEQDH